MSDKGIIFSAPMVRALLAGRKTQTRRLLKLPPAPAHLGEWEASTVGGPGILDRHGNETPEYPCVWHTRTGAMIVPPYAVGDRLYVREGWRVGYGFDHYREDLGRCPKPSEYDPATTPVEFLADGTRNLGGRSHPSIFLPRWASRLWLAVTDVRVQRLQECSEADAKAEGIEGFACIGGQAWRDYSGGSGFNMTDPCKPAWRSYSTLWDSLHTAEGARWQDNPWIVAVSFDVHRGNIDAGAAA